MANRLSAIVMVGCLMVVEACKSEASSSCTAIQDVRTQVLSCKDLSALSIIHADNERIITQTGQPVGVCAIYSLKGDSLCYSGSFLNKGNGPAEVSVPYFHVKNDTMFVVNVLSHGSTLQDLIAIPLQTSTDHETWKNWSLEWANPYQMFNSFIVLDGGLILATGGMSDENTALSLIDISSHEVTSLQYWPEDSFNGSDLVKKYVYSSNANLNTNGTRICYSCLYGGYIDLFSVADKRIIDRNTFMNHVPEYIAGNDGFHPSFVIPEDGRFRSVKTSDKYIYVQQLPLFTGKTVVNGVPWYCINTFDRYRWDGTFDGSYMTYEFFNKVIPSKDDSTIVAICTNETTSEEHISRIIISD